MTGEPSISLAALAEQRRYADGDVGVTFGVHHPVRDYDAWKPVFDEHESVRRRHGALEHRIYRMSTIPSTSSSTSTSRPRPTATLSSPTRA